MLSTLSVSFLGSSAELERGEANCKGGYAAGRVCFVRKLPQAKNWRFRAFCGRFGASRLRDWIQLDEVYLLVKFGFGLRLADRLFPKWFIIRVFKFPAATQCEIPRRISTRCPLVERWWNAGCPNRTSTSDLGLPPEFSWPGVNKVIFAQLAASCVDWWNVIWKTK